MYISDLLENTHHPLPKEISWQSSEDEVTHHPLPKPLLSQPRTISAAGLPPLPRSNPTIPKPGSLKVPVPPAHQKIKALTPAMRRKNGYVPSPEQRIDILQSVNKLGSPSSNNKDDQSPPTMTDPLVLQHYKQDDRKCTIM